ncbi:MAG: hypothetical protein Q8P15_01945 [Nanoarchaeota archaeon]|nr:hypothetical protein [Nanoarchaeota archaeon]
MKSKESKLLVMCSDCGAIKISEKPVVWFHKKTDSEIYHALVSEYIEKISPGYCGDCKIKYRSEGE